MKPTGPEEDAASAGPAIGNRIGRRGLKALLKITVLGVIGYFWYLYVAAHWSDLREAEWRIGRGALLIAGAVTMMGYLLRGCLWAPIRTEVIGEPMGLWQAFRISSIAWMGRYVPGKIWAVAGKAYLSSKAKADVGLNAVAATFDIVWLQVSGVLLGLMLLLCCGDMSILPGQFRLISIVVAVAGAVVSHPAVFCPLMNRLLRLLGRGALERRPRYRNLLAIMLGNMLAFVLWACGVGVIARSVSGLSFGQFPDLVAIFTVAWVCGFMAFMAPAGIGVRDSVFAVGLQQLLRLSPPDIVLLVVTSRLLSTAAEILCAIVALTGPHAASFFARSRKTPDAQVTRERSLSDRHTGSI